MLPAESPTLAAPARWSLHGEPDGRARLQLAGRWTLGDIAPRFADLHRELAAHARDPALDWDLRAVESLDDTGALLLLRAWARHRPTAVALKPEHAALLAALEATPSAPPRLPTRAALEPLIALGGAFLSLIRQLVALIELSGRLVLDALRLVRHPGLIPWREISANIHRTGGQALPITALVGFLVGVVLSYLSALQLRAYGADVYIVNVLGIGIIRELGPLLAAILVAGRSGSSMTAQLGVMRVTQELDALSVMGISHTLRLVLPKVLALAITLPLLVLWTDAIALIGGALVANRQIDISLSHFVRGLPEAVPTANLWIGFGKAVLFGALIALVACHHGLRVKPNTESLGTGTTAAVVAAITLVIVVDAIIAVAFSEVGFY